MEYNKIAQKEDIQFSDLDLGMNLSIARRDLIISVNDAAIKRSIKNLVLTGHYERPFHPDIGCNISKMLFELNTALTTNFLETEIFNLITNYEPRVQLSSVSVVLNEYYENSYNVVLVYYIVGATEPTTQEFFLERIR